MINILYDDEWKHIEDRIGTKFENLQDLINKIKNSSRFCNRCYLIYCKILAVKSGFWYEYFEDKKIKKEWDKIEL